MNPEKIILITSGQPALNPRLVKEADALHDAGYSVTVIYQYWNSWGTRIDQELLKGKKWKVIRVGGDPVTDRSLFGVTRVIHKISKGLAKYFGLGNNLAELAIGRGAWLLSREACKHRADLYIAHNLAALPGAVKAAKTNQAKCGFDAEDFHRNEMSNDAVNFDVRLSTFIEEKYFPKTDYLTASSPEIALKYQYLFPSKKICPVLNVFPVNKKSGSNIAGTNESLKLFWFSQSVGLSRGIQDVISAMKILEGRNIELHILGDLSSQVKSELDQFTQDQNFNMIPGIIYHQPVDPDELIDFASQFDIGLATEPGFSVNNDIALSNKLFTYINAGLAIIASDTTAQTNFIKKNPEIGLIYEKHNALRLAEILKIYIEEPHLLDRTKINSYALGQDKLNWETEKIHFLNIIKNVLKKEHTGETRK